MNKKELELLHKQRDKEELETYHTAVKKYKELDKECCKKKDIVYKEHLEIIKKVRLKYDLLINKI